MKSTQLIKLSFFRLFALGAMFICVLLAAGKLVVLPVALATLSHTINLVSTISSFGLLPDIERKIKKNQQESRILDSLLTHQPEYESFNESAVLGKLYGLFDASGCKVERIQVKDKSVVDNLTQVSIFIQGEGDYNACGSALSGIENMSLPVSVHQCTLKHIGNGRGAITLDFIVMEKTP